MNADELVEDLKVVVRKHVSSEERVVRMLQGIDRRAADPTTSFYDAVRQSVRDAARVFAARNSYVFLVVDGHRYAFGRATNPRRVPSESELTLAYNNADKRASLTHAQGQILVKIRMGSNTYICLLFELPERQVGNELLRIFRQYTDQMYLLIEYKKYRESRELESTITASLFSSRLRPSEAWSTILKGIIDYVPAWCPGARDSAIAQLLLVRANEGTLHLVAGDGANLSEFVLIRSSVTGRAVTERWKEPRLVRTEDEEFSELYKGYRKSDLAYELVIPIVHENNIIGVVNYESNNASTFNSYFVDFCREAAQFVAPILNSLTYRFESLRAKEVGLMYILNDMLLRMGETFGHLISQPFLTTKLAAGEIDYLLDNAPNDVVSMRNELEKLQSNIITIEDECSRFVSGLPDFLYFGPQDVCAQLRSRLEGLRRLAVSKDIEFSFDLRGCDQTAYGSRLFLEHVFNIVNNSFQKLREEQLTRGGGFLGRIVVATALEQSKTPSGKKTGVDFVRIVVVDNGGGVDQAFLSDMGTPGVTTKIGGNGFGISAAREYFASVGGELTFGNYRDGLRTIMKMRRYDADLHGDGQVPPFELGGVA